ncbi:uncharacterized protein LOC117588380 isoform X2 [Drosophila guanche]|uniref:DUF753 domain-containing protein n=1 Tax=Drosophila guanche TaxID=7266 RepID=A0A3B0KN47_DROGU|nr:uncharacterized protein LOC117588380 isoform X2 [Drosophila guanche]SPP86561.1 Hypothetical predicted protein [Drosophila guanche]
MKLYLLLIASLCFLTYISCDGCIQCNSKTEPRCATDPLSLFTKNCSESIGGSECFVRVLDGVTIRGCAKDLTNATKAACNNELECQICTYTEGCNRQMFPSSRAQCLQCSGNSTSSPCASQVYDHASICPIYKLGDLCYIRNSNRTADGSFQRGCLSTAQANKQCIKDGNCFTCTGRGCNFLQANDTLIPLARDSSAQLMLSMSLLLMGLLTAWML